MTTLRTAALLCPAIALAALAATTVAQQVNTHSNTARGGADVKQVPGRKIGAITTRGAIIHLELDAGVVADNLFDLDRRTIRFTPVPPKPGGEGGPSGAGFRAENLPLQWDAATGTALSGNAVSLTKFQFPFSGRSWDSMQVLATGLITFGGGFDPDNPTSVESADNWADDLKAAVSTSVVVGVDRELMPNLAIQANYSYTRTVDSAQNFTNLYTAWAGVTPDDYLAGPTVSGTLPDGTAYSVPTFIPDPAVVAANGNSAVLSNWPDYVPYYHGLEMQLVKRLSNRWMARVGFAWNEARETYGDHPVNDAGNPTPVDTSPLINGGQYVSRSAGSGAGDVFMSAKWTINANGVYQFPYDIEVGASLFGRQGYPFPVYRTAALGLDGSRRVLVSPEFDTYRFDDLWNLDLRFSKQFRIDRVNLQVIGDLFNVLNANTEMVRNRNAASPNFEELSQNLSPRILRFGVRVNF